jgi:single-stranded-DNA-specific exonuclease
LNLHEAMADCSEHLLTHGGHAAAAGLRMQVERVDAFRAAFCDYVAGHVSEEERIAEVAIDAEAPLSQLTLPTIEQIERMAPFGAGNPRPVLCASRVQLAEPPKRLGGGDRHLAAKLKHHQVTMRAVAFGHGDWLEDLSRLDQPIDVAYRPVINEFRGRRNVELHLVDWRLAQNTS